ncbi:MAG: hypothetical protein ACRC2H_07475 [Silanimonas sp.]
MAVSISPALLADMNAALKTALDGGFIYVFAGTVPTSENDALNMSTVHTQLLRLSLNGGSTGLTLQTPTGDTIIKTPSEVWSGLIAFDGANAASTTLTPTFYRFCPTADTGRTANTSAKRIQGSVGGPSSSADLIFGTDTLTRNGTNTESCGAWRHTLRRAQG